MAAMHCYFCVPKVLDTTNVRKGMVTYPYTIRKSLDIRRL